MRTMDNQFVFYGTGAAEGVPDPFCECALCTHARRSGGKDLRRRAMLRLGADSCIDLGPDAPAAARDWGHLRNLRRVLLTHTHEDHFYYGLLETRALAAPPPAAPLTLYLTGEAFGLIDLYRRGRAAYGGRFAQVEKNARVFFERLEFGRPAQVGNLLVTPLRGNHTGNLGEDAANYLVKLSDGRSMYYAVDTGYFLEETLAALDGARLDILICECTHGAAAGRGERPAFHLDVDSCFALFGHLLEREAITPNTQIYLTHINHKQPATHAQLQELCDEKQFPAPVTVAWDGLAIE